MKGFRLLVGVILAAWVTLPAYAASGKVWSEVKGDTVYVHHDHAWFNCCPDMKFRTVPHPDSAGIIDIYERDLGTHPCDCMCYFDFTHKLEGLAPGSYTARVWEDNLYDTQEFRLAGVTHFSIISKGAGVLNTLSLRSPCGGWSALKEEVPREGIRISGSSITTPVEINYTVPRTGEVRLDIFDVAANRVRSLEVGVQASGQHAVSWDGCTDSGEPVARGIYFVRLRAGDRMQTLPLIVLH